MESSTSCAGLPSGIAFGKGSSAPCLYLMIFDEVASSDSLTAYYHPTYGNLPLCQYCIVARGIYERSLKRNGLEKAQIDGNEYVCQKMKEKVPKNLEEFRRLRKIQQTPRASSTVRRGHPPQAESPRVTHERQTASSKLGSLHLDSKQPSLHGQLPQKGLNTSAQEQPSLHAPSLNPPYPKSNRSKLWVNRQEAEIDPSRRTTNL